MIEYTGAEQALLAKVAKARYKYKQALQEAHDAFDIACAQAQAEYNKAREGAQL